MNKQEVIDKLYDKLNTKGRRYPKRELVSIIDPFLESIKEALEEGNEFRLANFGKFMVKAKNARKYYNIQTGKTDFTPEKKVVFFTNIVVLAQPWKMEIRQNQ